MIDVGTFVLWLVLLVVAVGLPLLALYADRRAAASVPQLPEDDWAFQRRVGISMDDMAIVQRCLASGEQARDPRLRPLVAERGQAQLDRLRRWRTPGRRRVVLLLLAVTVVVVGLVSLLDPPHDATPYVLLLNPAVQLVLARRRLGRLRRAVASNGEPVPR